MNDVSRFKRGQIWLHVDSTSTFPQGVQKGTRPVLIFSSDRGNETNSSVIVLAITSNDKKGSRSVNVPFVSEGGSTNVILCNQINTVCKSELKQYLYTVSDSILEQVERAHNLAIGKPIDTVDEKIDKIYTMLEDLAVIKSNSLHDTSKDEKVIADVAYQLQKLYINMAHYHDATVEDLRSEISGLSDNNAKIRMGLDKALPKPSDDTLLRSSSDISDTSTPVSKSAKRSSSASTRKPAGYWTTTRIDDFLSDKNTMTLSDWMSKYGYTSEKSAMKAYYTYSSKRNHGR